MARSPPTTAGRPAVLAVAVAILVVGPALHVGAGWSAAAQTACSPDSSNVWFLSVVYDEDRRADFVEDVDNFLIFRDALRTAHCLPDEHVTMLAMDNGFQHDGRDFEPATEGALKDAIARIGADAAGHADPLLFYFHSSHGNRYLFRDVCPGTDDVQTVGSVAYIAEGGTPSGIGDEDGSLYDCELGAVLNAHLPDAMRVVAMIDCSYCGGFSDSITPASGSVGDDEQSPAGVVGDDRIVVTGCTIVTECYGAGSDPGGLMYSHVRAVIEAGGGDGWTSPAFPDVQGIDAPLKSSELTDGRVHVSELFFAAVQHTIVDVDPLGVQQQYRIKYGMGTLDRDVLFMVD